MTDVDKGKIKSFFTKFIRDDELTDDQDIFTMGLVNSLVAMQLVTFVEKEFDITVENEDVEIENFKSINAIADLVERKRTALVLI
jgi:methoxymalonate biosynthesis acyl carrier protein